MREAFLLAVNDKGLQMPDETVDYLLKRHSRDLGSLLQTVALLDRERRLPSAPRSRSLRAGVHQRRRER